MSVSFDQLARAFLRLRRAVQTNCHETNWSDSSLADTFTELRHLTEDLEAQAVYDDIEGDVVEYRSAP